MIKRIAVVALTASALLAGGCKDFLSETPKDFVGPDNFYRNATDAVAAVNAAYSGFVLVPSPMSGDDYYGRNFYLLTELPTEAMTNRLGATNERELIDNYSSVTPQHVYFYNLWRVEYFDINKANSVIDHVPGIDMTDATLKARVVGEAKFLRALHYFELVRLFGGVPLKLHETASLDSLLLPRATAAATYDQIITDLKDAATALPVSYAASERGRATKGAALALLGKAYLHKAAIGVGTAADYATAADYFKQVMALNVYSLDPNFASLFDGTNEASPEIIFSVQNAPISNAGGQLGKYMVGSKWPYGGATGQNAFQAELPWFNAWSDTDKRKAGSLMLTWTDKSGKAIPWGTSSSAVSAYGSTGPFPRKYVDINSQGSGLDGCDYIVLRYADVLLSLAEAINGQSGPTAEAVGYVNQVRTRAGLGPIAPTSKDDMRGLLLSERRWEFFAEGQGYFDNQRFWDIAKVRIQASIHQAPQLNKSPLTSSVPKWQSSTVEPQVTDNFKLYPIPQRAIQLNPNLLGSIGQNPGWQ